MIAPQGAGRGVPANGDAKCVAAGKKMCTKTALFTYCLALYFFVISQVKYGWRDRQCQLTMIGQTISSIFVY